jgi:hypothetical protein
VHDGEEIFALCRRAEEKMGAKVFPILDDNFLKNSSMPQELLAAMEDHGKAYRFMIYASADSISRLGVDFLVRLGIEQVWIGIETDVRRYPKLERIDMSELVKALQGKGITVTTSSMLFTEHHDKASAEKDIAWAIDIGADMHQFAIFTPMPGTCAFERFLAKGYISEDFDYRELHAMTLIATRHPHFSPEEARAIQLNASRCMYETHGPAALSKCRTMVSGYLQTVKDVESRNITLREIGRATPRCLHDGAYRGNARTQRTRTGDPVDM